MMTGSTVGVGLVVIALLWSGAISASDPQTWHGLFGLVCGPVCLIMIMEMLLSPALRSDPGHRRQQRPATAAAGACPEGHAGDRWR